MAVIGTGTQSDPYLVNNWTDFCSVKDENDKYIFWEDLPSSQKIVDLNDEVPGGYTESFTIHSASIDFNGWTIRNLTIAAPGLAVDRALRDIACYIKNGIFQNVFLTCTLPVGATSMFATFDSNHHVFENCVISGYWHSNGTVTESAATARYNIFDRCAINLSVTVDNTERRYWRYNFSNTITRLNINTNGTISEYPEYYNKDSKHIRTVNYQNPDSSSIAMSIQKAQNCVYIVDSETKCNYGDSSDTVLPITLVRSDNVSDTFDNDTFVAVTDEQLQNADYLFSLGFPIATGVGE